MILVGDIGGTNARLGLFEPVRLRPRQLDVHVFRTLDFPNLPSIIATFFEARSIDRATGGVYIGGGIAPKILPALETGAFLNAFRAKSSFESLLEKMPVEVILNAEAGLLGAAMFGADM